MAQLPGRRSLRHPPPTPTPKPTPTPTDEPAPAPATPTSVTVTRADGSLTATWDAVKNATSYHITYSSDNGGSWSLAALNHPDASIEISDNIDNTKTYVVGVRARNDSGDSGWRNSPAAGPYTPPPTPTPTPTPAPTEEPGAEPDPDPTPTPTPTPEPTATPTPTPTPTPAPTPTPTPEPTQAPDKPASVTVTRADGSLTATWPAAKGASTYHVTYSADHGGSWSLAAANHAGTTITINQGIVNSATYIVGVRARNSQGDSDWVNSAPADAYEALPPTTNPAQGDVSFGGATVANQSYTKDVAIDTLTLPAATGGNGTVVYSLVPTLPSGLSFNGSNRTLSGTPTSASSQKTYSYSASDAEGTTTIFFKIEVLETAAQEQSEEGASGQANQAPKR